ncbi:MAG: winged helix-turn-helix transcriptional regulator, partial [Thermoplasmata archaeon]
GFVDIAILSDSEKCSVLLYLQRDGGTRSEFSLFSLGNASASGGRVALGELNGDPYTDIVVRVQNRTYIFYQDDFPPYNANHIPSDIYFNENTIGDDLIKLDDYIKDDHGQLKYYVEYESDPELLHAVVDGAYLDFYAKEDWVGRAKFKVSGWDGDPNHSRLFSNKFIVGVNDVPDILSDPNVHAEIGEEYLYQVEVRDTFPRDDELMFELFFGPDGMTIDPGKGEIRWTPEKNGEYKVAIMVKDRYGGKTEQVFLIIVGEKREFPAGALLAGVLTATFVLSLVALIGVDENARFLFFLLVAPLYTKIKREKILDHFVRGQIYGYILANPGEHYNGIREALGLTNGSLAHHLRTLERERFVKSKRFGIYRRFYPMHMRIPEDGFRANEIQKTILRLIEEHPGISQKEIAGLVNLTPPTINYHVGILANAGLIRVERNGRKTECYLEA